MVARSRHVAKKPKEESAKDSEKQSEFLSDIKLASIESTDIIESASNPRTPLHHAAWAFKVPRIRREVVINLKDDPLPLPQPQSPRRDVPHTTESATPIAT